MIKVYTDGACSSGGEHNGVGGYAYAIVSDRVEIIHAGGERNTTNNRMEILAFIESMKNLLEVKSVLKGEEVIQVHSDSQLVINTLKKGSTWKRNKNNDLWEIADKLIIDVEKLYGVEIEWYWVKAHTKGKDLHSVYNHKVDNEAVKVRDLLKASPSLESYRN